MGEGNRVTDRTGLFGNPKGKDPYESMGGYIISTEESVKHNSNIILKYTLGVATCFGF
jgi:hypothetical protein